MEIEHFSHDHMLSLSEKKREEEVECVACEEDCDEGLIYSCRTYFCRFNLHESCAKLPQELHNPLLHPHPLSLVRPKHGRFSCDACGYFRSGFSFRCDKCDVDLDVKCAFIWPAVEGEEAVVVGTHFSHRQHPLVALKNITDGRFTCELCKTNRSDPMIYGCLPCGFFLHPSCFKLPKEVFHPFHPYHPLTLKRIKKHDRDYRYHHVTVQRIKDDDDEDDEDDDDVDVTSVKCNACREDMAMANHFAYFSEYCNNTTFFCLGAECASVIMPAITYEGHDHLLQFRDNIVDELIKCSACNSTISESYAFRCLDLACDFNLHLTCGPLPSTIQHQSHIDPLILTICPIEDEKDCEPDEFYCDACEEQRVDRLLPIYYCKECHFVAEISCVISEVLSSLKGERGDVELRNPFGQFGNLIREKQEQLVINPALTLSDIFNSLSEAEKKELSNAFLSARSLPQATSWKWETITSIDWEYREVPFKGDEAYTQFMKFADIGLEIPIEFRDTKEDVQISNFKFCYTLLPKEEVVDIEDYKITRKLAPILKGLLSKYGDVSAQSNLSPKVKLYFFLMLCDCIYSMIHTKVVDITKKDLLNWWASLETSKLAGFRIQFAFDHLKRVAHAHFGLYGKKQGSKALAQLDRDIEALKEKRKFITSIKSRLIEECSREVSILQGGKAGLGLL